MITSKRHHFVPAFYLAGFTDGEDRDSPFWCAGKDGKIFPTNPNNACMENNYYTLTESSDPTAVENMYSGLEGDIANSLRYIKENNWTPRPIDEAFLHIFAATLYLRVPEFRNSMATPIKRVQDIMLDMWSRITLANARNGGNVSEDDFLNATRVHSALLMREHGEAFGNDHYASHGRSEDTSTPSVSRDLLIKVELNMLHDTAKSIALRRWFLFSVPECEKCEFITSDNSFVLLPGKTHPKMYGLLTRGTEVVIPLHKRAVLFGTFEKGKVRTPVEPKELVAEVNECVYHQSNRWIYSLRKDIVEQLAVNHSRHAGFNAEK